MTEIDPAQKELEEYQKYFEKPEYREQLKKWYREEKRLRFKIIVICLVFLCISSFGQFSILDYSFGERLDLSKSDKIFGIEIKVILSLLVTAALPITTLVDESEILGKKLKISLANLKFSPIIWIVLPGDILLTLQAVLVASNNSTRFDFFIPAIAFALATIFSTFVLYLTKGIVATARQYMSARKILQIITIYGVNPIPLYKNAEQIKLSEEAEQARKKLEEERIQYQQALESQKTQYEEQLKSQELEHIQKVQELERDNKAFRKDIDSLRQFKTKFNKVMKPIVNLTSQGKEFFEKFSTLSELLKDFKFPKLETNSTSTVNSKSVEIPTYYWRWQNSEHSWQELQLPSELSSVGCHLLAIIQQQKELPPPTNIRNYAPPRKSLSKCLVLDFENYGIIVYCRDEEYRKDGEKWDIQDQLDFKRELNEQQSKGYDILEFTAQEIMSYQLVVLEQIKDVINRKVEREPN